MNADRAYSILNVKAMDDARRTLSGIATSPTTDRVGDVVESLGVRFKNPMPLLWQHDAKKPVGWVRFGKANKDGIPFEAEIANIEEPGTLKDRVDEAWQSVRAKLVTAVSIGFRAVNNQVEMIKGGGIRWLETEVMELSLVTIPANPDATITSIKQYDQAQMRAASGTARVVSLTSGTPGVPGPTKPASRDFVQLILRNPK